ncbi:MAG: methionine--tRNA ligase [Bacteroidetes bacterium]|nr:methionine--tRNA ligase [Bacteroidota bacterium]
MVYTITAALPYANGPIHIGHLAGVYVPADIYSRYLKLKGKKVLFLCGSDEHGVPITIRAKKENKTPQQIVDYYHEMNKKSFEDFGIQFDIFSRTSSKIHYETASEFFKYLYDKGIFEIHISEQYYDEKEKTFLADRYIIGTCPKCKYENAYGDQCEKCGSTLSPSELKNPKSAISGEKPILKKTKHWYLPLNKYQKQLEQWILKDHKDDWKTNVYGQCKSWLDDGLKPRAVTRDLNWGVPVPLEEAKDKVLYVWFDAPIGYISATKEWAKKNDKDWKQFWQKDKTKLIHFVGKDNIVFHCIIFPAMLMAHGDYVLPENVPANEFMNLEGQKISTSRDWAVWLPDFLKDYPNKQDVLRYVLCANAPETKDSDFTWADFKTRNNSELVAIVGNFVNRVIVLIHKYYDGLVPKKNELKEIDNHVINELESIPKKLELAFDKYKFREGLSYWLEIARIGNKYLADTEPWKIKDDDKRVQTIMNIALQIVANLYIVSKIFMPLTSDKLKAILNIQNLKWQNFGSIDLLKEGNKINKGDLLFEKIEK